MSKIITYFVGVVLPIIMIVAVFETYTQGEIKIIPRTLTRKEYTITYHYMKTSSHSVDRILFLDNMNEIKNFKDVIKAGGIDSWIINNPKFSNREYEKMILRKAKELKSNLIIAIIVARTQEPLDQEKWEMKGFVY